MSSTFWRNPLVYVPLLLLICALYVVRLAPYATTWSHTVDEPYHVGSAVAIYESRAHTLGVQHPPLPRLVMGLPLVLMGAELPNHRDTTMTRKEDAAYEAGTQVLFSDGGKHYWSYLRAARLAMLIFPVIALVYLFLLGKWLLDERAGLAAALLFSLDTTLLGHGLWICTDAAAAAGFLAALYHGARFIAHPTWLRTIAAGIAAGLGVSCKFSVGLAAPALLLILIVHAASRPSHFPKLPRLALRVAALFLISLLTLWATYLFHIGPMANSDTLAAAPQWSRLPAWVKDTPIPMPAFPLGLGRLAAHSATGHTTYLLGQLSLHGVWYYFPLLLLTKTPLSLLVAMFLGLLLPLLRLRPRPESPLSAPPKFLLLVTLVPAGLFMLASMFGGIQIGIRHILPALPLLYLLAAVVLTRTKYLVTLLALLSLGAVIETSRIHPDYIAYFNLTVRNPRYVATDSNLDWGQDLRRLAESPYASQVTAIYPLGDRNEPLFDVLGLNRNLLNAPARSGSLIAISSTRILLGPPPTSIEGFDFKRFESLSPQAQIGHGMLIYQIPPSPSQP